MKTTVVNLMLDRMLPEELRDPQRVLNKEGVEELMLRLAKDYPDKYAPVAEFLSETGAELSFTRGETFRLEDFKAPDSRQKVFQDLERAEQELISKGLEGEEKNQARLRLYSDFSERLSKETNQEALSKGNNIALTVLSGARGKKPQLRDLLSSPGFYQDYHGAPIPWFIRRSFSEGLSPADFLAGTYAGRSAVTESKKAVAKGGFLAKTLSRVNYSNLVAKEDCGTTNGIDLSAEDKDIRGRVLQRPSAGYPAGTIITRDVYRELKKKGGNVIVRSPSTCESEHGMCAKCYGVTSEGRMPRIGEHFGATASQALGEPLAQSALSMKHVTSGSGAGEEYSGLDYLYQFTESPEEFKNRTVVSPVEGVVESVREAPQGGQYLSLGGAEVYIPPDRKVMVEAGQELEAGDPLTDGLMDPEDVIKYKGLGAGRRYYAEKLRDIAEASGAGMDRRNFEVLARTAVDHIRLEDPISEGYLPDDVVSFNQYLHKRPIPEDTRDLDLGAAKGKYLQQNALHFTPGTKITNSVADRLKESGFGKVSVSDREPGFEPQMMRLQAAASFSDDWLGRMGSSYLTRNFEDSKTRALDTNIESNYHPVPRMAVGVNFGDKVDVTGKF